MTFVEATFKILNKKGLHARAASKIVALSRSFSADIFFEKDGHEADAKSLLDIMTLAASQGSQIKVRAKGQDAYQAISAIGTMIHDKFGEEA